MSIPLAMSPVGYDTWVTELRRALITYLGTFHLEVDYLPDEKKLVVHTDRVSDETYAEVAEIAAEYMPSGVTLEQYNHHWEVSWRDINKYAACKNIAEMEAVNPDYKNDLTSNGTWVYPLPNLERNFTYSPFQQVKALRFFDEGVTFDHTLWTGAMYSYGGLFLATNLEKIPRTWTFSNSTGLLRAFTGTNVQLIPRSIKLRKLNNAYAMCQSTPLRHIEDDLELVSLREGSLMFSGCQLDAESVPRVVNSLPSYTSGTHALTIGIHIDHKYDPEVNTVLKRAGGAPGTSNEYFPPAGVVIDPITDDEYKGWTLTVQWNGTATENAYPAPTTT